MADAQLIYSDLKKLRSEAPLVHNITNYVVMNWTANCLLAIGASPAMAHAQEEVEAMVALAGSLVINIGTLSQPWVASMEIAMKAARKRGVPVVLDPVGAGATPFRTSTLRRLLDCASPSVIRGNASEILALAGSHGTTKGVDSTQTSNMAVDAARRLSHDYGCVVCVSGEMDFIIQGELSCRVSNGHSMMTRVTGMGCAATALIGAFAAVQSSPIRAATHAMAVMGICGELASSESRGPGSFQAAFLDHLYQLDEMGLKARLKLESPRNLP